MNWVDSDIGAYIDPEGNLVVPPNDNLNPGTYDVTITISNAGGGTIKKTI